MDHFSYPYFLVTLPYSPNNYFGAELIRKYAEQPAILEVGRNTGREATPQIAIPTLKIYKVDSSTSKRISFALSAVKEFSNA